MPTKQEQQEQQHSCLRTTSTTTNRRMRILALPPMAILTMAITLMASTTSAFAFMTPSSSSSGTMESPQNTYSSPPVETKKTNNNKNDRVASATAATTDAISSSTTTTTTTMTAPWRISLNLGREMATPLWDSFGTSGIRFPVVVPCSFSHDGTVTPTTDTISYVADVNGGVTKPVQGGTWKVEGGNHNNNNNHNKQAKKTLEFALEFPQELVKKDVRIPAGSQLVMEGVLYSQEELKAINDAFSQARVEEWKALEKVDAIQAIRDAPKRWNEETQRWEHPTVDEPFTSLVSKHWTAFVKGQERKRRFQEKPRSGVELSVRPGRFPGFDEDNLVYVGTRGVIRNQSKGGMVVGTWSAEPITGQPASYSGNY